MYFSVVQFQPQIKLLCSNSYAVARNSFLCSSNYHLFRSHMKFRGVVDISQLNIARISNSRSQKEWKGPDSVSFFPPQLLLRISQKLASLESQAEKKGAEVVWQLWWGRREGGEWFVTDVWRLWWELGQGGLYG